MQGEVETAVGGVELGEDVVEAGDGVVQDAGGCASAMGQQRHRSYSTRRAAWRTRWGRDEGSHRPAPGVGAGTMRVFSSVW